METVKRVNSEIYIPLGNSSYAVVDFKDWGKVQAYSWHPLRGRGQATYAQSTKRSNGKKPTWLLHRLVWGVENIPSGFEIAHTDGDGLNCRRSNLKCLTHAQNLQGKCAKRRNCTSEHRGVCWNKQANKWYARISSANKSISLGNFNSEEEAARAYDAAAIKLFGEYAALNFPAQKENSCLTVVGGAA